MSESIRKTMKKIYQMRALKDRFLYDFPGVSVGVCYSDCVEKQIPKDEFDRPVDILITDSAIFRKDNGYGL